MGTPLGLNVPERTRAHGQGFDVRPRKVEQWLGDLPMANVGETARLVFSALTQTNREDLTVSDRLRFLEMLREPVLYITEALKKHFLTIPFPLPPKAQKVAALARELCAEMATGYKIALEDSANRSALFSDNRQVVQLIHRALTYQGRMLLTSYQVYGPFPPGIWKEIHSLYAFAERKKLHGTPVADGQRRLVPKSTVSNEYKRILLLSLASPYRLRQGEAERVYINLERWAVHAHLNPIQRDESLSGRFVVVLDGDYPPSYIPLSAHTHRPELCRTLSTDELARVIREQIAHVHDESLSTLTNIDKQTPNLSSDLMRRLMLSWGVTPKRSFSRTDKRDKVVVAMGLTSMHHFISRDRGQRAAEDEASGGGDNSFDQPAHYDSIPVLDVNQEQPDVWELVYPHDVTGYEQLKRQAPAEPLESKAAERYHADIWKMVNESAGGCCLVSEHQQHANVLVGELIGLRRQEESEPRRWGIGVIRWMKSTERGQLTLGVQMLTPDAAPIAVRPVSETGQGKHHDHRALLLPELAPINQPATVITPPVPYRVGSKVTLTVMGHQAPVELTKLMENTGLFAQFQFALLDKPEHKPPADNWVEDRDFANVWSVI
ncbi:MAG TPA: hypothetical protein VKA50_05620 [Gammaproteobacteria bacterium]|nr:hypothetical protein [Gammaproteobacteria bacterium]